MQTSAYCWHAFITAECFVNDDCTGVSNTCVSNVCNCGSSPKCSGTADTCQLGLCKCGELDECSEAKVCTLGECHGK